eukprot:CAMPEP_0185729432 /NCGR_PEP_ID=MMETSP1171-20130828/5710_1 /TAXON_ID=374046 /ORGANISM="Helicotheca tamensis, Strain CCMP826" /LENGTH=451 /DNA_ID=CAMNT_0028398269 /DNA_START=492 /DNA_END=1847 /DNA_ORIENTATION=-
MVIYESMRPISTVRRVFISSLVLLLLLSIPPLAHAETDSGRDKKDSAQGHHLLRQRDHENVFDRCRSTFELQNDNALMVFNKFNYSGTIDGAVHVLRFPDLEDPNVAQKVKRCEVNVMKLDHNDFPITPNDKVVECLELSNAISVRTENDYSLGHCVSDLMNAMNAQPVFPEARKSAPFWKELKEVVEMRMMDPTLFAAKALNIQLPDRWGRFTLGDMAGAVYDEPPCYWQGYIIRDILSGKYGPVTVDDQVMKWRGNSVEFIDGVIALTEICTWAVFHVSNHNFAAKYLTGMPRPEEVAYAVAAGEIRQKHVPDQLYTNIMKLNLNHAVDFTAYPDGSPRHPSYPAMHSAASNISFWLQVVLKPTAEQICEMKKIDYAVSYARTVAGVHYPQDNKAGLKLGQEIMKRELPHYLSEKFHGDEEYIREKVEKVSFNWDEIDPADICDNLSYS